MSCDYFQQYDDFISAYAKIYHLKSNESLEEILNLILNCLVDKCKISIHALLFSITNASAYNYRSKELYSELDDQLCSKFSIQPRATICIGTEFDDFLDSDFSFKDEYNTIIMNDQIDKFRDYVSENGFEMKNQSIIKRRYYSNSYYTRDLEKCAYFGSVNIFNFIQINFHDEITLKCLRNAIVGGNTDLSLIHI